MKPIKAVLTACIILVMNGCDKPSIPVSSASLENPARTDDSNSSASLKKTASTDDINNSIEHCDDSEVSNRVMHFLTSKLKYPDHEKYKDMTDMEEGNVEKRAGIRYCQARITLVSGGSMEHVSYVFYTLEESPEYKPLITVLEVQYMERDKRSANGYIVVGGDKFTAH